MAYEPSPGLLRKTFSTTPISLALKMCSALGTPI